MTDEEKIKKLLSALGDAISLLKDGYHDGSQKDCAECDRVREIEATYDQLA